MGPLADSSISDPRFSFTAVLNVFGGRLWSVRVLLLCSLKDEVKSNAACETVLVDFVPLLRRWLQQRNLFHLCATPPPPKKNGGYLKPMMSTSSFHPTPEIAVEKGKAHLTHLCSLIFTIGALSSPKAPNWYLPRSTEHRHVLLMSVVPIMSPSSRVKTALNELECVNHAFCAGWITNRKLYCGQSLSLEPCPWENAEIPEGV